MTTTTERLFVGGPLDGEFLPLDESAPPFWRVPEPVGPMTLDSESTLTLPKVTTYYRQRARAVRQWHFRDTRALIWQRPFDDLEGLPVYEYRDTLTPDWQTARRQLPPGFDVMDAYAVPYWATACQRLCAGDPDFRLDPMTLTLTQLLLDDVFYVCEGW